MCDVFICNLFWQVGGRHLTQSTHCSSARYRLWSSLALPAHVLLHICRPRGVVCPQYVPLFVCACVRLKELFFWFIGEVFTYIFFCRCETIMWGWVRCGGWGDGACVCLVFSWVWYGYIIQFIIMQIVCSEWRKNRFKLRRASCVCLKCCCVCVCVNWIRQSRALTLLASDFGVCVCCGRAYCLPNAFA